MSEQKGMAHKAFTRLLEHGHHDDIRYRGPLTYQSFQVLGWLCIVAAIVTVMINLGIRVNPDLEGRLSQAGELFHNIAELALPLLLIANFARILGNVEGYGQQLLRNGLTMLVVCVAFNLGFNHFFIGSLKLASTKPDDVMPLVTQVFHESHKYGFVAFNLFVDLFLCTLFMFFLNYRPRRVFVGKWRIAFRLFAILPVGYEFTSIMLRVASATGRVVLPTWSFPLLTVKPPISFIVFMLMAIFIKTREWRYCRNGSTHEDYQAFLRTNLNSLHFSVFMAVLMVIAGIVDYVLLDFVAGNAEVANRMPIGIAAGIGESISLIFVAPLVLLLSYTRQPRLKGNDILIPLAGVALGLIVVLQGGYQILAVSKIPTVDFHEIKTLLEEMAMIMTMR